jgi:hypothetical protein
LYFLCEKKNPEEVSIQYQVNYEIKSFLDDIFRNYVFEGENVDYFTMREYDIIEKQKDLLTDIKENLSNCIYNSVEYNTQGNFDKFFNYKIQGKEIPERYYDFNYE